MISGLNKLTDKSMRTLMGTVMAFTAAVLSGAVAQAMPRLSLESNRDLPDSVLSSETTLNLGLHGEDYLSVGLAEALESNTADNGTWMLLLELEAAHQALDLESAKTQLRFQGPGEKVADYALVFEDEQSYLVASSGNSPALFHSLPLADAPTRVTLRLEIQPNGKSFSSPQFEAGGSIMAFEGTSGPIESLILFGAPDARLELIALDLHSEKQKNRQKAKTPPDSPAAPALPPFAPAEGGETLGEFFDRRGMPFVPLSPNEPMGGPHIQLGFERDARPVFVDAHAGDDSFPGRQSFRRLTHGKGPKQTLAAGTEAARPLDRLVIIAKGDYPIDGPIEGGVTIIPSGEVFIGERVKINPSNIPPQPPTTN